MKINQLFLSTSNFLNLFSGEKIADLSQDAATIILVKHLAGYKSETCYSPIIKPVISEKKRKFPLLFTD